MTNTAVDCEDFAADLSALIDAELPPDREAAVRAHLAGCSGCSERLEALCDVDLELASAGVPAVPVDLWQRLSARLAEAAAAPPAPPAAPRRDGGRGPAPRRAASSSWAGPGRCVWSAVAAAAAAAVLYLAVTRSEPPPALEGGPAGAELAEAAPAPAPEMPVVSELPPAPARPSLAESPSRPAARPEADPLDQASEEDLVVLLELETIEDLDVIANLDLLEGWLDLQGGASG